MNEKNGSVENYKNFIDTQFSFDVQKSYFGNTNSNNNSIRKISSPNSSLKQLSQQSLGSNSPQTNTSIHQNGQQQTFQSQFKSLQKSDLSNIKKQFNNKQYEIVLDLIDKYLNQYHSSHNNSNNEIKLNGFQTNNNGQQQQHYNQQEQIMNMNNNHYSNENNNVQQKQSSNKQIESDDRMEIEDKKEKENNHNEDEVIILMQTKSDCYLHLNRLEEFFKCQDDIYNKDQSQTKVFISKGSIYFQNKRYKESLNEFQKYVQLVKTDDNAYYLKGLVEEKLKLHQEALNSFEQSLMINPIQIKVIQKRTLILATLFRYEEAVENQKKVIQYFEQNRNKQNSKQLYQQYFMMGKLYFHMQRIQDSYSFLEKAISERSDHSETYYYLGECFRSMNQLENAIECYEKAALYDCNNTLAINRRDEVQQKIISESPQKNQSQQSTQIIEEEQEIITLDDIKKDIEKLETDKKAQIQKMKEGNEIDCDLFELESSRTLVQQYSLNLAAFKSFLRVQDSFDRASVQSHKMMSSIHNFKGRMFQSTLLTKEEESENNSMDKQRMMKTKSLFSSTYNFRAPNPPNQQPYQ